MPKDFILFAIISLPSEHNIQFGQTDVRLSYHLCTSENAPILFHNEGDFKTAMNIIALASKLFPDIKILTFEVMNNHLHFALCGNENRIHEWLGKLVALLRQHPELKDSKEAFATLREKLIVVGNLDNLRNVIA